MQLTADLNPPMYRAGNYGDLFGARDVATNMVRGYAQAGRGVFKVPGAGEPGFGVQGPQYLDPGECYQQPSPAAAASATALLASAGGSTAGIQVVGGASLNGAVGLTDMFPPRKVTFTLSSHADWDATTLVLRGKNAAGAFVSENIAIPNGGNATLTSVAEFKSVTGWTIPAQSGVGGTYTAGIAVLDGTVNINDFLGVCMYQPAKPPATTSAEFEDGDALDVLTRGAAICITEQLLTRSSDVYVRTTAGAGGSLLGAFRGDSDSGTCVQVVGAKVERSITTLAKIRFA